MSVNNQWVDFMRNTIGAIFLSQFSELDTAFADTIGSLSIGFAAGINTDLESLLIGNTTDRSCQGHPTTAPNMTESGDLPFTGTNLQGPWTIGCLFRHDGAAAADASIWALGSPTSAAGCYLKIDTTNLSLTVPGVATKIIKPLATLGITDNAPHLIAINYRDTGDASDDLFYSIDGTPFAPADQPTIAIDGVPASKGITILEDINHAGGRPGKNINLDELFVVDRATPTTWKVNDAEIALIWDRAGVTGFPPDSWPLITGIGGGMGIN